MKEEAARVGSGPERKEPRELQSILEEIVGKTGRVVPLYGGYEIEVGKPDEFPWREVFEELLRSGLDVWIKRLEDRGTIVIMSKPASV